MSLAHEMRDPKRQVLKDVFGYDHFRPGQERVIDALLAGRNVLTVMPTGSGKSLCFQVPALVLGGLTIVVSPLLALMRDQVQALRLAGVAADAINSSQDRDANVAAWRRAVSGETRLLYLAPERLMTDRMLAALAKLDVRLIAIDEAHCISQWGPSFRPEYQALSRLDAVFPDVPIAALTATADQLTRSDIASQLFGGHAETVVLGFDRPNITLAVEPKRHSSDQLLAFMEKHAGESGIVYCLSRKGTEETAALLVENGIRALPYHAGMPREMREAHQNAFMTEPSIVIVATIAFGMGIDKPDVRYVFHVDLPSGPEAYYQELGRCGRDGKPADAHMLFGFDDIRTRRRFIEQEDAGDERKRRENQRLSALVAYCEASTCRRQVLLGYFGERAKPCGNCDVCLNPGLLTDGTSEAKKILTAVSETGNRYGAMHLVDVLTGSPTDKILQRGHEKLPSFGTGGTRKRSVWQSLIRQLVAADFLAIDIDGFGGLMLTDKGRAMLRGEGSFHYRSIGRENRKERKAREGGPATQLAGDDATLLTALKQLRMRLARERQVPPYVIFSDRSLIDMAQRKPLSVDEFGAVNGVGAAKLRDFAAIFLAAIRQHAAKPVVKRSDRDHRP